MIGIMAHCTKRMHPSIPLLMRVTQGYGDGSSAGSSVEEEPLPDTPPYTVKGHSCYTGDVKCVFYIVRRCFNVAGSMNIVRDVIKHA